MAFNKSENEAITSTGLSNVGKPPPIDQSYGTLFEGLGQALANTLNAYDQAASQKIEMQADEAVNQAVEANMPPGLEEGINNLQSLASAKAQGAISETKFLTDLNVQAKRLRAQYPKGYGPQIEQAISAAAGRSTANDLRKARIAEMNASMNAVSDEMKNMRDYLESPENAKYLNTGTMKEMFKARTGKTIEEFTLAPTLEDFNTLKFLRNEVASTATELSLLEDKGKIESHYRDKEVQTAVSTIYRDIFNDTVNPKYGEYMRLKASGSDPSGPGGSEYTAEEIDELNRAWGEFSFRAQADLQDFIIRSGMKPEEAEKFTKQMKEIMTFHAESLTNQHWGINNMAANKFKNGRDQLARELIGKDTFFGELDLVVRAGGTQEVVNSLLVKNADKYPDALNNLAATAALGMISGKNSFSETVDKISEYETNAGPPSKALLGMLTDYMGSEISTPETTANAALRIFTEKNYDMLARLAEKDRIGVFEQFMSPRVIELIKQSGNEEALRFATNWGSKQFEIITKPLVDSAMEGAKYRSSLDIKWDGKQFVVTPIEKSWGQYAMDRLTSPVPGVDFSNPLEGTQAAKVQKNVSDLNRYIATMTPLWQAQGINAEMALAFKFGEINQVDKTSFLAEIGNALFQAIAGGEGEEEKKPPSGKQSSNSQSAPASRVVAAGKGWTTIEGPDGTQILREGSRNWRNNNPGNIEYGNFAKSKGAIGTDGRFAVFPTYEAGRVAKEALLFESKGYAGKTIAQAIARYAPAFENDTGSYTAQVARAAGVSPDTPLADLTPEQRSKMLDAMEKVEGFKPGKETQLAMADD